MYSFAGIFTVSLLNLITLPSDKFLMQK